MWRYLRLYGHFMRFSISRAFEFRVDFFFRVIMDLAYVGIQLAFYKVVFLQTTLLGGWNQDETFIFVAGYLVVDGLAMTIFSNNMWYFPVAVNKGDMDYYLVRPVSSLFFLSVRDFAANSLINLAFACGILAWAITRSAMEFSAASLAVYAVMLALGAVLHYLVHMLTLLPVFWLHSSSSLHGIFYSSARLMERPDRIYTGWVRKILVTVLPFCLMASFPARVFLEGWDWRIAGHFLLVAAGLFGGVVLVWNAGLRAYSSASS